LAEISNLFLSEKNIQENVLKIFITEPYECKIDWNFLWMVLYKGCVFLNVDQKQKMVSTEGPNVKMSLFLGTTYLSLNST
jgi:hypothetical protein